MNSPPQFFWNIETLWEKNFQNKSPYTDFSALKEQYEKPQNNTFLLEKNPNFSPSFAPVFEDEDKKKYKGLQQYSLCFQNVPTKNSLHMSRIKPVYFFDNHHQALFPFWEIFGAQQKSNPLHSGVTIVHIDAHRDNAIFPSPIPLQEIHSQTTKDIQNIIAQCRVSDYLDAGKKIGLIDEIISITQSSEFELFLETQLQNLISKKIKYILNLDIDIYGPEGTAVSTELKTKTIAKAWSHADAVCFATSPGFIDPLLAQKLGEIFY